MRIKLCQACCPFQPITLFNHRKVRLLYEGFCVGVRRILPSVLPVHCNKKCLQLSCQSYNLRAFEKIFIFNTFFLDFVLCLHFNVIECICLTHNII